MEGFFEKYKCLFETECVPAPNGECLLWPRKPQKNGYGAVKYKCPISGLWRCTTAHRLSFMVFNQNMDITGQDISHLCHNKLCVRGEHLSAEPHAVNNARQKCVNRCCCSGHGEFPDCVLYLKF